jgi:CheY-like chemotaxis protein
VASILDDDAEVVLRRERDGGAPARPPARREEPLQQGGRAPLLRDADVPEAHARGARKAPGLHVRDEGRGGDAQVLVDKVLALRGTLEPDDKELGEFYEQNKERWNEGERVLASRITIRLKNSADPASDKEGLDRITQIRTRVTSGKEDFAKVAQEVSEMADKARGGDLGWVVKGRRQQFVNDGVEAAIFKAAKNTVTDITTGLGQGADDYVPKPFDYKELQARIRARLRKSADVIATVVVVTVTLSLVLHSLTVAPGIRSLAARINAAPA